MRKLGEETEINGNYIKKNFRDVQDSSTIWMSTMQCTCENRLLVLQWKILHNIYPKKIILEKIGKRASNYCDYCKHKET